MSRMNISKNYHSSKVNKLQESRFCMPGKVNDALASIRYTEGKKGKYQENEYLLSTFSRQIISKLCMRLLY